MIFGHRRGYDEGAGRIDVRGIVPGDDDSQSSQIVGAARVGVASRDCDATAEKELGEAAHAGAGDADEVDWATVGWVDQLHARKVHGLRDSAAGSGGGGRHRLSVRLRLSGGCGCGADRMAILVRSVAPERDETMTVQRAHSRMLQAMTPRYDPIPDLKRQVGAEVARKLGRGNAHDVAAVLGTDQPRISDLRRGKLDRFSLETLLRYAYTLQSTPKVVFEDRPLFPPRKRLVSAPSSDAQPVTPPATQSSGDQR
jgi:hypothetical protein